MDEFFFRAAALCPERQFLFGGSGWPDKPRSANTAYLDHVYTRDHNAFNVTPRAVLNVSRESMARYGFSPATRVFEAAGAGACIITDAWEGIELFLEPGREILVARDGLAVAEQLRSLGTGAGACHRTSRSGPRARGTYLHTPRGTTRSGSRRAHGRRSVAVKIVVLGLSITSSWGNGHATTYRGLVRALSERGHEVLFLERDVPWYAENRDLRHPPYGKTELYGGVEELRDVFAKDVSRADLVIVGSFVPDGVSVGEWVLSAARGVTAFYDIDTPVTLAKLAKKDYEYVTPQLAGRYDLYLSFTGGPTLDRIRRLYGAPKSASALLLGRFRTLLPRSS